MNERIKKLAEQAKDHADYYAMLSGEPEQEIFTKKFAELIVQECVGIADEYDGAGSIIVSRIEKHFGVEE
jgi:hypothetical protein